MNRTTSAWLLSCLAASATLAQTPPAATNATAVEILSSVRRATGGEAWNQFAECKSEGTITFAGKSGTIVYAENLRTGANDSQATIPELGVRQGHGVSPDGNWQQDDDGYISLSPPGDSWQLDDLYLTRRGYWQPNFGGAAVTVLEPVTENGATSFERLEFQVPGGHGFTIWVNRANHFIERVVHETSITFLSDYRPVEGGVLLPFHEKKGSDEQELVLQATKRTLLKTVQEADFTIPFQKDYDMPASGSVTVPAQGGIVFQAKINGKGPYTFFFDTGSLNVLSESLAKELGLQVDNSKKQTWQMNSGSLETRVTRVETVQIGDLILHNQQFHVLPIPASTGTTPVAAIGYEVLLRLAVKVDYEHQQLTFYNAPTFHYSGAGVLVPLTTDGITLEVSGEVDGTFGTFALDTGNEVGFLLNPWFVQQNNLMERLGAHYQGYSGKDYAGPNSNAYYARAQTVRIGDADVHDVIAYLWTGDPSPNPVAGNIGRSILRRFNPTFDVMRRNLYLEKNGDWAKPEVFTRAGILCDAVSDGEKIMTVLPGSPAEAAGIAVGDVVTRVDGHAPADEITDPAFLQPAGTAVKVTVKRGNAVRDVQLTLKDLL